MCTVNKQILRKKLFRSFRDNIKHEEKMSTLCQKSLYNQQYKWEHLSFDVQLYDTNYYSFESRIILFYRFVKRMSFETGFQFMLGMADIQIGL